MMRTQPPWFRWAVGAFAALAALAFALQYRSAGDRADLVLAAVCAVTAAYWLIFDRAPVEDADGEDERRAG